MNQRKKKRFLIKKITIAVLISIGIVLLGSGAYVYKVYHDVRKATDKMYKEIQLKELPVIVDYVKIRLSSLPMFISLPVFYCLLIYFLSQT